MFAHTSTATMLRVCGPLLSVSSLKALLYSSDAVSLRSSRDGDFAVLTRCIVDLDASPAPALVSYVATKSGLKDVILAFSGG